MSSLRRPSADEFFDVICSHCAFHSKSFPSQGRRCILNWSTYLFMDEGPDITEPPLSQSGGSSALLLRQTSLSSFTWRSSFLSRSTVAMVRTAVGSGDRERVTDRSYDVLKHSEISANSGCELSQKRRRSFHHDRRDGRCLRANSGVSAG